MTTPMTTEIPSNTNTTSQCVMPVTYMHYPRHCGNDDSNSSVERMGLANLEQTRGFGLENMNTTNSNSAESRLLSNANSNAIMSAGDRNGHECRETTKLFGLEGMNTTERNSAEARGASRDYALSGMEKTTAVGKDTKDNVDRFGFAGLEKTSSIGKDVRDTVDRFGFAGMEKTSSVGKDTRDNIDRFGFANMDKTEKFGLAGLEKIDRSGRFTDERVENFGFKNMDTTRCEGKETRHDVDTTGDRLLNAIHRSSDNLDNSAHRYGLSAAQQLSTVERSLDKDIRCLNRDVFNGTKEILLEGCKNTDAIKFNVSEAKYAALLSVKDQNLLMSEHTTLLGKQADTYHRESILLATCNTAALQASVAQGVCKIELQASQNTAALQLESLRNKCSLELQACQNTNLVSKQLSDCCCELKEIIRTTSGSTNDLINLKDSDRIRDELRQAQQDLLVSKISCRGQ